MGFTAPRVKETKIDGFHDLLELSWTVVGNGKLYAVIFCLIVLLLAILAVKFRRKLASILQGLPMALVFAAATLVFVAQILDFGLGRRFVVFAFGKDGFEFIRSLKLEESDEVIAAVYMFWAAALLLKLTVKSPNHET